MQPTLVHLRKIGLSGREVQLYLHPGRRPSIVDGSLDGVAHVYKHRAKVGSKVGIVAVLWVPDVVLTWPVVEAWLDQPLDDPAMPT